MFRTIFEWLDNFPAAYWIIAVGPTLALVGFLAFTVSRPEVATKRWSEGVFWALVIGVLLVWRWPLLFVSRNLNPDEGQLVAGAMTLLDDPVFWRSVDGTTSGPLNYYVLWPLHLLGLPLDYFTARLTGLGLLSIAAFASYRLLRSHMGVVAARLVVLPAIFFFATVTAEDFVHYSSEHVSLTLFAVAAFGLMRRPTGTCRDRWFWLAGAFIAGLMPWAKLQAAPLFVVLLGGGLWVVFTQKSHPSGNRWRLGGELILAAVAPSILVIGGVLATGQFEHFWRNYVMQNFVYVQGGSSLRETIQQLVQYSARASDFPSFFFAILATLIFSAVWIVRLGRRPSALVVGGVVMTGVALVCVLAPHRAFTHYLLLTILPLTLLSGAIVGEVWAGIGGKKWFALVVLIMGCAPVMMRFASPVPEPFGRFVDHWQRPHSLPATILREYTTPGEPLGIWGWRTDLYVETGLIQATRDPHSVWSIQNSPNREYYRARYLADLKRAQPSFFVDAVGIGSQLLNSRAEHGHEVFAALGDYIRQTYTLVADLGAERLYVRRDRQPPLSSLRFSELQGLADRARPNPPVDAPPPESMVPGTLNGWDIDGLGVSALLPPASMTWALDGQERAVLLRYGFHDDASGQGQSNGADLIVELQSEGSPARVIFHRNLNPASHPPDRGFLESRVPLPPFSPGTRLVVRTEPGAHGDAAWDWVYLAPPKYEQLPSYSAEQFPGFARRPNQIEANRAELLCNERVHVLLLNGSSTLTYVLEGAEARLKFSYGFESSELADYRRGKGAVFWVELQAKNGRSRRVFERELLPSLTAADRGRQWASVDLTDVRPDTRLVLRVEPLDSHSAEGTYITDLVLE